MLNRSLTMVNVMDSNKQKDDSILLLLQEKVDNHIEEFHEHRREYQVYREEEAEKWDHYLRSLTQLAEAQSENTKAINDLTVNTKELLSAWQAAMGTVRTLSAVGKFFKWLGSFAIIGVFFTWFMEHFGTK